MSEPVKHPPCSEAELDEAQRIADGAAFTTDGEPFYSANSRWWIGRLLATIRQPTEPDLCGESDSDYRDRLLSAYPSGALASEIAEADTEGLDAAGGVLGIPRGEPPVHDSPESHCAKCSGRNARWHAPSPLWNAVMRRDQNTGADAWGIVCPACFQDLAERKGFTGSWHFAPHGVDIAALWVDADERRWDESQCLWVVPEPQPQQCVELCGEFVRLVQFGTCANPKPCPLHDDDAPAPTYTVTQASTSTITEPERCDLHAEPQPCESAAAWMDRVGTDAREWSREFIRIFGNRSDEIDEALMIGWFANAIEAGRNAGHADQCEELERVKANLYAESLRGDALCKRLATLREETDRVDMSWHDAIHKIAGDLHPNALLFNGKSTLLDMLGSGIARLRERIAELEKEAAAFESAVIIYKGEDRTLRSIFDDGECREVCKLCKDPECRDFDCEIPDPPDRETFENR